MAHAKIINMAAGLRPRCQINTEFREKTMLTIRKANPAFDFSSVTHFSSRRSLKGDSGTIFLWEKKMAKFGPQNYRKGFQNWLLAVKMRTHVERKQGKTEQLQGLVPTLWSCI